MLCSGYTNSSLEQSHLLGAGGSGKALLNGENMAFPVATLEAEGQEELKEGEAREKNL